MDLLLPLLVIFLAVFTQSLSGFGIALVSMAMLPGLLGIQVATPLVALVAITLETTLLIRYHASINLRAVRPLIMATVVGIPIGVLALRRVDEEIALTVLGVVIAGYALYALSNLKIPELRRSSWAYLAGFLSGLLSGAYNTGGPPVIIYGNARRWQPAEFKSNLQGLFVVNDILVITSHALSGNFTPEIWRIYLWSIPVIAVAILAGLSLDKYLNPTIFLKVVLVLLVILGIRLIL
jgi:uncharacterized protein